MKILLRHPLRVTGRLIWFGGEVLLAVSDFLIHCAFQPEKSRLAARAAWLQRASRRSLRILKLQAQVAGPVPGGGLLVCNHLSYLDIPVLASLAPAVFVAKRNIRSWPVIGWLTSLAGTLFVDRGRRTEVGQTNEEIRQTLEAGVLVILFPEGTSSDGQTVLPFKSSLLEPATQKNHPLSVALIQYQLDEGDVREDVCYWRDMTFFPHLLNLLGLRTVRASVRLAPFQPDASDRKELAKRLHAEVLRMKDAGARQTP
jgi:1-acyl-sn-glycerol-3-phosphate acyltransferase